MKNLKYIVLVLLVAVVGFLGWQYFANQNIANQEVAEETSDGTQSDENVIVFKDGVYTPSEITIQAGERVTFRNGSDRSFWPATDLHPTHTNYPGSSIGKCGSTSEGKLFDACKPLPAGSEYSFTFTEAGSWTFHDHLRPSARGTIIVE